MASNKPDGAISLKGADILRKQMDAFGPTVSRKAADQGIRKQSAFLAKKFKSDAPKLTGHLRSAIRSRYYRKSGLGFAGLRKSGKKFAGNLAQIPFYYKVLEFGSKKGGGPTHPFMERSWYRYRRLVSKRIISETQKALYDEATKVHAKTLRAINNK